RDVLRDPEPHATASPAGWLTVYAEIVTVPPSIRSPSTRPSRISVSSEPGASAALPSRTCVPSELRNRKWPGSPVAATVPVHDPAFAIDPLDGLPNAGFGSVTEHSSVPDADWSAPGRAPDRMSSAPPSKISPVAARMAFRCAMLSSSSAAILPYLHARIVYTNLPTSGAPYSTYSRATYRSGPAWPSSAWWHSAVFGATPHAPSVKSAKVQSPCSSRWTTSSDGR